MQRKLFRRQKNDPWHLDEMNPGDEFSYTGEAGTLRASRAVWQYIKQNEMKGIICKFRVRKHPTDPRLVTVYRLG